MRCIGNVAAIPFGVAPGVEDTSIEEPAALPMMNSSTGISLSDCSHLLQTLTYPQLAETLAITLDKKRRLQDVNQDLLGIN